MATIVITSRHTVASMDVLGATDLTDLDRAVLTGTLDAEPSFAERLNALMEEGPGPTTNGQLSQALDRLGYRMDRSYVSLLRRGEREAPAYWCIAPLSQVFKVPVAYWFSEEVAFEVWALRSESPQL